MQARGFMGLTCPAGGGRNTLPIMGAMGSVEGLGNRLPETGNVFPLAYLGLQVADRPTLAVGWWADAAARW